MPRKKLTYDKVVMYGIFDKEVYRFYMPGLFKVDGISYIPNRYSSTAVHNFQPLMSIRNDYEDDESWEGHGSVHWHRNYSISEKCWIETGRIYPANSEKDRLPDEQSI